jgi:prepilin-type N-terminal cleavage/methylation domain-containing protein
MLTAQLTKHIKKQQGFTLIELLVVIGILAVLLAIDAIPNFV